MIVGAVLAQVGLGSPLVIFLIPILLAILIGGPLLALLGVVLSWWRRDSPLWGGRVPRWLGLYAFAANTAFLCYTLVMHEWASGAEVEWPARTAMGLGLMAMVLGVRPLLVAPGGRLWGGLWGVMIAALVTVAFVAERENWRRQTREDLLKAATSGDLAAVQAAIDGGLGEPMRGQMLSAAATYREAQPRVVELLLRAGADLNTPDEEFGTLWRKVASHREVEVIRVFLANGADPNASWKSATRNVTPAFLAWARGDARSLDLLRRAGARDVDAHEAPFQALVEAARAGDLRKVQALHEAGVPWTRGRPDGSDVLIGAGEEGRTEVLRLILTTGDCAYADAALLPAAVRGQKDTVVFLLTTCVTPQGAVAAAKKTGDAEIGRLLRSWAESN